MKKKFIFGLGLLACSFFLSGCDKAKEVPDGTAKHSIYYVLDNEDDSYYMACYGSYEEESLTIEGLHEGKNVTIDVKGFENSTTLKTINFNLEGADVVVKSEAFKKCNIDNIYFYGDGKVTFEDNALKNSKISNLHVKDNAIVNIYSEQPDLKNLYVYDNGLAYTDRKFNNVYLTGGATEIDCASNIFVKDSDVSLKTHSRSDMFLIEEGIVFTEKDTINCKPITLFITPKSNPIAKDIYIPKSVGIIPNVIGNEFSIFDTQPNVYFSGSEEQFSDYVDDYKSYYDKICKYNVEYNVEVGYNRCVNNFAHDYVINDNVDPLCEAEGYIDKTCKTCGLHSHFIVESLGHDYGEGQVEKAATCIEKGIMSYVCKRCGEVKKDEIELTEHTYDEGVITINPTCQNEGSKLYSCTVCTDSYSETISRLPHNQSIFIEHVDVTCSHNGYDTYDCSMCHNNKVQTNVVEQLPHTVVTLEAVAPTCLVEGVTQGSYCSVCEQILTPQTVINKLEHIYSVLEEKVAPTCTSKGYSVYKCELCNFETKNFDYVDELPHNPVDYVGYPATCSSNGKNDGKICSVCGTVISGCEVISPLPHTDTNPADGICDVCSEQFGTNYIEVNKTNGGLALIKNNPSGYFYLTSDVDATDFETIPTFSGKIFGNGYSINNLNKALIKNNTGEISDLRIKNFTFGVTMRDISSNDISEGLIASTNNGTIKNISVSGDNKVTLYFMLELKYGYTDDFFENIIIGAYHNNPNYKFSYNFGSVCGKNTGTVTNCDISGSVYVSVQSTIVYNDEFTSIFGIQLGLNDNRGAEENLTFYYGGIVGKNEGTMTDCTSSANQKLYAYQYLAYAQGHKCGILHMNFDLHTNNIAGSSNSSLENNGHIIYDKIAMDALTQPTIKNEMRVAIQEGTFYERIYTIKLYGVN